MDQILTNAHWLLHFIFVLRFFLNRDEYDEYGIFGQEEERNIKNGRGDVNNGVCYFIVGDGAGSNDHSNFVLHPTTHELIVSKELDREQKSEYELVIR